MACRCGPSQRWLAQYRRDSFAGLARRERRDRGHRPGLPPELTQMIEGLALRKPPPTVALVHRQVRDVALRNEWPVPNYKRVYRVIKHLDPALVTLAHDGSNTYRTTYDLLYRREADKPNDIWQADHTLLDIWVRHDGGPRFVPGSRSLWMITAGPLPALAQLSGPLCHPNGLDAAPSHMA